MHIPLRLYKIISLLAILLLTFASKVFAQGLKPSCWVIEDMKGVTYLKDSNYKLKETVMDGITLVLNGDKSSISTPGLNVWQADDYVALLNSQNEILINFEVIQIDPVANLAIYTKNMRVTGHLSAVSGAMAMVCTAKKCE